MAKTQQFKLDATRPFYAAVGVTDLAVAFARDAAADVQTRIAKLDLEPKALRDQARTVVVSASTTSRPRPRPSRASSRRTSARSSPSSTRPSRT